MIQSKNLVFLYFVQCKTSFTNLTCHSPLFLDHRQLVLGASSSWRLSGDSTRYNLEVLLSSFRALVLVDYLHDDINARLDTSDENEVATLRDFQSYHAFLACRNCSCRSVQVIATISDLMLKLATRRQRELAALRLREAIYSWHNRKLLREGDVLLQRRNRLRFGGILFRLWFVTLVEIYDRIWAIEFVLCGREFWLSLITR